MISRPSDEDIERIESKIAHLERGAAELSDVVFRQHLEIRALEMRLQAVQARLATAREDTPAQTADLERPPHY